MTQGRSEPEAVVLADVAAKNAVAGTTQPPKTQTISLAHEWRVLVDGELQRNIVEVEFNDVALVLTMLVCDVGDKLHRDIVDELSQPHNIVVAMPRRDGSDYFFKTFESWRFAGATYRAALLTAKSPTGEFHQRSEATVSLHFTKPLSVAIGDASKA